MNKLVKKKQRIKVFQICTRPVLFTRANISFKKNVDRLIIYIQHCTSLIEIHKENSYVNRSMRASPLGARGYFIINDNAHLNSKQNVLLTMISGRRPEQSIYSSIKGVSFYSIRKDARTSIFNIRRSANSSDKIAESFDTPISCTWKIDE